MAKHISVAHQLDILYYPRINNVGNEKLSKLFTKVWTG